MLAGAACPLDVFQVRVYLASEASITEAGDEPRPGSPVFTVCAVVMSECSRKNMLLLRSSTSNLSSPSPKMHCLDWVVSIRFIQVETQGQTLKCLLNGQFAQLKKHLSTFKPRICNKTWRI